MGTGGISGFQCAIQCDIQESKSWGRSIADGGQGDEVFDW